MILQLNPPLWVQTPLGEGWAVVIIDYGIDHNPVFLVHIHESGIFKSFDTNDCLGCENFTYAVKRKSITTTGET